MFDFSSLLRLSRSPTLRHSALGLLAAMLLPSAQGAAVYIGDGGTTSVPATYSSHTFYTSSLSTTTADAGGSAYAYGLTSSPGVTASYAEVDYTFQIHGPASPFAIPLAINANGSVIGSGLYYTSFIEFIVDLGGVTAPNGTFFGKIDDKVFGDTYYHPGGSVFLYDNVVMAPVDSDISVKLIANVNVGGCCAPDGTLSSSTAYLDPLFSLVGNPAGYSIVGVPGQDAAVPDQTTTVPEPTGWALLLIGLGSTGPALRRRRARRVDFLGR